MFKKSFLKALKTALTTWETEKDSEIKRERKKRFISESGTEIKRVYTPLDLEEKGVDYLEDIGLPGAYPFTRGLAAAGYREQLWSIQQYSGHATAEVSNKLWKTQIAAGSHNLAIAYDLPTQFGYDPDDPRAEGEIARVGISLSSLRDWEIAFQGIDLTGIFVGQVLNAPAVVGLASLICLAEQKGVKPADIRGALQNDILKEYQARGCYVFPPEPSLRLSTDIIVHCAQFMPLFRGIDVCTYHHSEAGATPVHEAAIGLANCIVYFENAVARGLDIDTIARTVRFVVGVDHRSFFEHIAKLRAMRKLYARILKERFHARNPQSMRFNFYAGKRGSTMHRQQYINNIARSTIAGMAAVFAGSQAIGIRSYDEAFGIPSEEAILVSTRVQQIIGHETGIADTVDPLAGSYLLETLTKEFDDQITEELKRIDEMGGALRCTMSGYFRRMIAKDAYEWQQGVRKGEIVIVGVNRFTDAKGDQRPNIVYRTEPSVAEQRIASLRNLKRERDNRAAGKAIDAVKSAAAKSGPDAPNLVPCVIEAVRSYCTIGEVSNALREVWGEYRHSDQAL